MPPDKRRWFMAGFAVGSWTDSPRILEPGWTQSGDGPTAVVPRHHHAELCNVSQAHESNMQRDMAVNFLHKMV